MKVTLAYPYTDEAGKNHKPDTSPDLPEGEALDLLNSGRARAADAPAPTTAKPGASKENS